MLHFPTKFSENLYVRSNVHGAVLGGKGYSDKGTDLDTFPTLRISDALISTCTVAKLHIYLRKATSNAEPLC